MSFKQMLQTGLYIPEFACNERYVQCRVRNFKRQTGRQEAVNKRLIYGVTY